MRKGVIITLVVVLVLVVVAVIADRGAVAVAESQVSQRIEQELPGASEVSTEIQGFPVLTQVAAGKLQHVTVSMSDVPTEQGTVDSVVVELYDVTTASPSVAGSLDATAVVPLSTLQSALGADWELAVEGDALTADYSGSLPLSATVVPVVKDGELAVDFRSFTLLGVEVSADRVPDFVVQGLTSMVGDIGGELPFGLTPTDVRVVPEGVQMSASGTNVELGSA